MCSRDMAENGLITHVNKCTTIRRGLAVGETYMPGRRSGEAQPDPLICV